MFVPVTWAWTLVIFLRRCAAVALVSASRCTNLIWQVFQEYFPVWISVTASACECYWRVLALQSTTLTEFHSSCFTDIHSLRLLILQNMRKESMLYIFVRQRAGA